MLKYFLQMQSQQKKVKKLVIFILSFSLVFISSLLIISAQFSPLKKSKTSYTIAPVISYSNSLGGAPPPPSPFAGSFFNEESLMVTKESDGLMSGTLRAVLLQASGIRSKNPFTKVRISFDPSLKKVILKKNLATIQEGLIHLDCGKAIIDGSQIENSSLESGEQVTGIHIKSSENLIKNCQFSGFKGYALLIEGNRNQISKNTFGGVSSKASSNPISSLIPIEITQPNNVALFISNNVSENFIEDNEFIGNQEGISFAANVGNGNRLKGNTFEGQNKAVSANENPHKTSKIILKEIRKENDVYLLTAQIPEKSDIEIYLADPNGKEGKTLLVPATAFEAGEASFTLSNPDLQAGLSKIVALSTRVGKNTSEFSEALLIPAETPMPFEAPVAAESPTPAPSPAPALPPPPIPIENFLKENTKNDHKELADNMNAEDIKVVDRSTKPINDRADSALSVGVRPAHSQLPADGNLIPPQASAPLVAPPSPYDPYLSALTPPLGNVANPAPAVATPPTPAPIANANVNPNANTIDVQKNGTPSLPADSITLNLGGIP